MIATAPTPAETAEAFNAECAAGAAYFIAHAEHANAADDLTELAAASRLIGARARLHRAQQDRRALSWRQENAR